MDTWPLLTAVARPVDGSTVAIAVLREDQVKVFPLIEWPFASSAVALNNWVPLVIEAPAGVTATEAVTCDTVTDVEPCTPSAVAVIVAEPLPTACTRPALLTVTTFSSELCQAKVWPGMT